MWGPVPVLVLPVVPVLAELGGFGDDEGRPGGDEGQHQFAGVGHVVSEGGFGGTRGGS